MRSRGFTLIELMVVLAVLALLVSYVAPRYFSVVSKAEEAALRHNLFQMRDAIDKFYSDRGRYPNELKELTSERYLRAIPTDPFTGRSDTWVIVAPAAGVGGRVFDVKSGSTAQAADNSRFSTW
jgi:general secretion pathway protein G